MLFHSSVLVATQFSSSVATGGPHFPTNPQLEHLHCEFSRSLNNTQTDEESVWLLRNCRSTVLALSSLSQTHEAPLPVTLLFSLHSPFAP